MEGVQRRAARELFELLPAPPSGLICAVDVSFFEIYGGRCQDLLHGRRRLQVAACRVSRRVARRVARRDDTLSCPPPCPVGVQWACRHVLHGPSGATMSLRGPSGVDGLSEVVLRGVFRRAAGRDETARCVLSRARSVTAL